MFGGCCETMSSLHSCRYRFLSRSQAPSVTYSIMRCYMLPLGVGQDTELSGHVSHSRFSWFLPVLTLKCPAIVQKRKKKCPAIDHCGAGPFLVRAVLLDGNPCPRPMCNHSTKCILTSKSEKSLSSTGIAHSINSNIYLVRHTLHYGHKTTH